MLMVVQVENSKIIHYLGLLGNLVMDYHFILNLICIEIELTSKMYVKIILRIIILRITILKITILGINW